MRIRSLSLTLSAASLIAGVPAGAEQISRSGESGARVQVTVSARIISGESVRIGSLMQNDGVESESKGLHAPMVRTRGQIILDDDQRLAITEFH